MKKYALFTVLIFSVFFLHAQENTLTKNALFKGAEATLDHYKAIYQLDSNKPEIINKTFRNIRNVLEDPRLKGKIAIELVTFSGGTEVMLSTSVYKDQLIDLIEKGVQISQCTNSLKERNLKADDMYAFIAFVPSGNGELVIRGSQGWVIIKP